MLNRKLKKPSKVALKNPLLEKLKAKRGRILSCRKVSRHSCFQTVNNSK